MTSRAPALRAAFAFFGAAVLAAAAIPVPVVMALEDQYGRPTELRVGVGRAVVAVVSPVRAAAEEISAWDEALAGLPGGVDVYRIADLKALPFFVPRGAVTKDLREKHGKTLLLLDWKGEVSAALGGPKRITAVLVFGPDGMELGRVEGAASLSGALKVKDLLARAR